MAIGSVQNTTNLAPELLLRRDGLPQALAARAVDKDALDRRPRQASRSEASSRHSERYRRSDSELTDEEKREVQELKRRDREVRAHEQAHKTAAGRYARGSPRFESETGPDGRQYAVGGEVAIDSAAVAGDPAATIEKLEVVRRAALAPKDPSSTDRQVAASASREISRARQDLKSERAADAELGETEFPRASDPSRAARASYRREEAPSEDAGIRVDLIG